MHKGRDKMYLADPDLSTSLRALMLHEDLTSVGGLPFPDESRIPKFACHTKVFTTSHHSVRFAAFGGSRNAIFVEVILLSPGNGDQSVLKSVLGRVQEELTLTCHVRAMHIHE